jgi:hypothetical protein
MIRSQVEEVHEFIYKDIEQSKMGYYSKEGILVLKEIFALTKCSTVFKIT